MHFLGLPGEAARAAAPRKVVPAGVRLLVAVVCENDSTCQDALRMWLNAGRLRHRTAVCIA